MRDKILYVINTAYSGLPLGWLAAVTLNNKDIFRIDPSNVSGEVIGLIVLLIAYIFFAAYFSLAIIGFRKKIWQADKIKSAVKANMIGITLLTIFSVIGTYRVQQSHEWTEGLVGIWGLIFAAIAFVISYIFFVIGFIKTRSTTAISTSSMPRPSAKPSG